MPRKFVLLLLITFLLVIAPPGLAQESVSSRHQQRVETCKAAIAEVVDGTSFGNPPVRFTGRRRTQAINAAYSALQLGLTTTQVYEQTYSRLSMIRNHYFRRDIAIAATQILGRSRGLDACK
jgi:hypothetical protein